MPHLYLTCYVLLLLATAARVDGGGDCSSFDIPSLCNCMKDNSGFTFHCEKASQQTPRSYDSVDAVFDRILFDATWDRNKGNLQVQCSVGKPMPTNLTFYSFINFQNVISLQIINCNFSSHVISHLLSRNSGSRLHNVLFKNVTNANLSVNPLKSVNGSVVITSPGEVDIRQVRHVFPNIQRLTVRSPNLVVKTPLFPGRLRSLEMSYSRVEVISPDFFKNSTLLKYLNLSNNRLSVLSVEWFKYFSELRKLVLTENLLSTLPVFSGLPNLRELYLEGNRLRDIGDVTFLSLHRLEILALSSNSVITVTKALLSGLPQLKEVHLANCSLTEVDENAFINNTRLEIVDMSHNRLNNTVLTSLQRCPSLQTVDLSNNKLSQLGELLDLPNLYNVDLSHNVFKTVSLVPLQVYMQNMNVTVKVSLLNNSIEFVDLSNSDMILQMMSPTAFPTVEVYLGYNPLICDCSVSKLWLSSNGTLPISPVFKLNVDKLRCKQPDRLKGRLLKDLLPEQITCPPESPCPKECDCFCRSVDRSMLVKCRHDDGRSVVTVPVCKWKRMEKLVVVMEPRGLTELPVLNNTDRFDTVELYLANNSITLNNSLPVYMNHISVLDLRNNNITRLPDNIIKYIKHINHTQFNIKLSGNPWICDCGARDFHELLQIKDKRNYFSDFNDILCDKTGRRLFDLSINELCISIISTVLYSTIPLIGALLVASLVVYVYYRYGYTIKVWLYSKNLLLWLISQEDLDKDKLYDAFISYSHKDEEFVTQRLAPSLEPEYKLCLHYRDWRPGEWIQEQIVASVEDSRRTVVVLSPNFIESVWGKMEFRAAHSQALQDRTNRVVVVVYGDVPPRDQLDPDLAMYLQMNTYLRWDDPWFWEKLRYSMPHYRDGVKKRRRKSDKIELIKTELEEEKV